MSPHEARFVRRVFALGGSRLRPGEERRLCVEIDADVVRVLDDPDSLPVIEVHRLFGVTTRRDRFGEPFEDDAVLFAMRAARRLRLAQ